jgi:RimJ/RimL family protein N-acetyltransferase
VLKYAFEKYGAKKLTLSYYEGNKASRRVIDKCGFEFVETLPKHHQSFATGEMMDEHCYAMTKDRWRAIYHVP